MVWQRLGDVPNLVDPFFGSNAFLLARPGWDWQAGQFQDAAPRIETVNDLDGLVANFWRAVKAAPDEVAEWADQPVNECDLHARHIWLVRRKDGLQERVMGDPDFYDAKVAGWWCWGLCCWIGGGWCSSSGPWTEIDGKFVHLGRGMGVDRRRVHLGRDQGVIRQVLHIYDWMAALSARLRLVRVCCGDWGRVLGPTPTTRLGLTGILLDPPYSADERDSRLYRQDDGAVSAQVRRWAIEHGEDPLMRIALCGYGDEHVMPNTWERLAWKATGGYGSLGQGRGRENANRETIWFSPHCLKPDGPTQLSFSLETLP